MERMIISMKAVVKTGSHKGFIYKEVAKPSPGPNEMLIKVHATAICGTDISYYEWNQSAIDFTSKFNVKFPFVAGHEFSGEVIELGSNVKSFKIGDRVAAETHIPCGECFQCKNGNSHNCMNMGIFGINCDGCFSEYTILPESIAFKLPENISFEEGALLEPAGVAMRAVEEADVQPGETALVFGCGAIGLFAVKLLLASGVSKVLAVDIDQYRVDMAKRFGAIAINSLEDDLDALVKKVCEKRGGVDIILEMTGSPKVYETLFDYLRLEGKVVTVGHPGGEISINITKNINLKGAKIKGLFGRRIWNTWYNLSSLLESDKVKLLDVVTHRLSLSQFEEAFEQVSKDSGKVMFII
jgi:threonine 3-dehydrogenase